MYHFGLNSLFANDSTANANNGSTSGVASGTGQIAAGANFAGGGYVSVPDSSLLDKTTGTWEFWFRDDGPPSSPAVVQQRVVRTQTIEPSVPFFQQYCVAVLTKADVHDSVNGISFASCNGALFVQAKSATNTTQTAGIVTTAGWHLATFSFTSGSTYAYYEDGALLDSGSLLSFTISSAEPFRIGLSLNTGWPQAYIGLLDEVRLSSVVRSADWIATEYYTENSPATFVTVGTEGVR